MEVIEEPDRLQGDERALLLCEDSSALRRIVVRDRSKLIEIGTMDLLRVLETRRRIQSSEQVFLLAEKVGRRPSRMERMPEHDAQVRAAIEALVKAS